jgi:hypothetical protein
MECVLSEACVVSVECGNVLIPCEWRCEVTRMGYLTALECVLTTPECVLLECGSHTKP